MKSKSRACWQLDPEVYELTVRARPAGKLKPITGGVERDREEGTERWRKVYLVGGGEECSDHLAACR